MGIPTKVRKLMQRFKGDTIRADGRIERTCNHGIGHTVAMVCYHNEDAWWVHGCDGCCNDWPTQREGDLNDNTCCED